MAKNIKNRKKQNLKKAQKQKKRQERIKKQVLLKKATPRPDIEDLVDYALGFVEKGDFEEGKRLLDKLKEEYRFHAPVYYGFGVLAAFNENYEEAIQSFNKAIEIKPDFVEAQYNLGVTYQKQFKMPEMITAYRQVVKIGEPGSYTVHHAQDMLNSIEQQMRDSNGVSLDEYLRGYQFFEQGVKYMESENWEAAITEFNSSINITHSYSQPYGNLGICYANIGKKQDALDAFDKAIELDPHYEPALLNRKIVESLAEGECLGRKVKTVDYYRNYSDEDGSYIKEFGGLQGLLPEKK